MDVAANRLENFHKSKASIIQILIALRCISQLAIKTAAQPLVVIRLARALNVHIAKRERWQGSWEENCQLPLDMDGQPYTFVLKDNKSLAPTLECHMMYLTSPLALSHYTHRWCLPPGVLYLARQAAVGRFHYIVRSAGLYD